MRLPFFLYFTAILTFIGILSFDVGDIISNQKDPVLEFKAQLNDIPTAVPTTSANKTIELPHFSTVKIGRGIHLIHDESLPSRELQIEGPPLLVEHFSTITDGNTLALDFTRLVRSGKYLKARINLNENGIGALVVLGLTTQQLSMQSMRPQFSAEGVLTHRRLILTALDLTGNVTIMAGETVISQLTNPRFLKGSTNSLVIVRNDGDSSAVEAVPNLERNEYSVSSSRR